MTKWIPCSERLPKELTPVNVTWVIRATEPFYQNVKDKPFTATAVYFKGQWYWFSSAVVSSLLQYGRGRRDMVPKDVEILAWMPLPEPCEMFEENEETPMTKEEALYILQNTAWYGTNEDRERTEQAVEMVSRLLLRKDAEEDAVIMCKDCKYWDRDTLRHEFNDFREWDEAECEVLAARDAYGEIDRKTEGDDYCSRGERQ